MTTRTCVVWGHITSCIKSAETAPHKRFWVVTRHAKVDGKCSRRVTRTVVFLVCQPPPKNASYLLDYGLQTWDFCCVSLFFRSTRCRRIEYRWSLSSRQQHGKKQIANTVASVHLARFKRKEEFGKLMVAKGRQSTRKANGGMTDSRRCRFCSTTLWW